MFANLTAVNAITFSDLMYLERSQLGSDFIASSTFANIKCIISGATIVQLLLRSSFVATSCAALCPLPVRLFLFTADKRS